MFGRFKDSENVGDDFVMLGADFVAYANAQPVSTATAPATPLAATAPYSLSSDLAANETDGVLSFTGARLVLMDAARQTMTPTLFAALQAMAKSLNTAGGPTATYYVAQMIDNVVLGNSANAYWNGGAAVATPLGNLSATSTKTQFQELVGKWFLGTDMPGDASAPGQGSAGIAYQAYTLPLFSSAGPKITDVSQGQIGDCWFLAALGETAMQDPSLIANMIVGSGTRFCVEFWVDGRADFVTVNNALPTYTNGAEQCDGSRMTGANSTTSLWAPLVEKALAQLSEQAGVVTGMDYAGGQNQYYELNSGGGEGIGFLTGQATTGYDLGGLSSSALTSLLGKLDSALASHEDVLLGTSGQDVSGSLVADHMFAVTGIDATAGTVSLYNPWGANAAGNGKPESFTIAASALVADDAYVYAALGAAKAA